MVTVCATCNVISLDQQFALVRQYELCAPCPVIISWLLTLLKSDLYIWCFVFRYSAISIVSAQYVASVCNKPLSSFLFSHDLSDLAIR